jgi:hypothetical protein
MSQYVAYLDGRLEEVALDRYAQAVFEEVKVKTVGKTVPGPIGPVEGAMVARELHSDGTTEDKIFAPSYGEFRTSGGGDLEALALAGPSNAGTEPLPAELRSLSTDAIAIFELVRLKDWNTVSSTLAHMNGAWRAQRTTNQPRLVAARLDDALHELAQAAQKHAPARTGPHRASRPTRRGSRCGLSRSVSMRLSVTWPGSPVTSPSSNGCATGSRTCYSPPIAGPRCSAGRTPSGDGCREPPIHFRSRGTTRLASAPLRLGVDSCGRTGVRSLDRTS